MGQKLIFLDFDGVLNSMPFLKRDGWFEASMTQREHVFWTQHINTNVDIMDVRMIDPEKIVLINQLIKRTGAQVVVSSSWRIGRTIEALQDILEFHGFIGEIIDVTGEVYNGTRGDEINEWLCKEAFILDNDEFIIIDDDSDMEPFMSRLVHTSMEVGLTQDHVDRAVEMLNVRH